MEGKALYENAVKVKKLYNSGIITRKEAKEKLTEYESYYNNKSLELAKKYNQKPVKFSFNSFMR